MKSRPIKKRQHLLTIYDLKEGYLYETVKYNVPYSDLSSWYGAKIWLKSPNTWCGIDPRGTFHDELYFTDDWRFKLSLLNSMSYIEKGNFEIKSFKNGEKSVI